LALLGGLSVKQIVESASTWKIKYYFYSHA
jgi:hypothetical protein